MHTTRWHDAPPVTCAEIEYRIGRLLDEAADERLVGPRDGLRQHVGLALMALGRAIHGIEPEHGGRRVLDAR